MPSISGTIENVKTLRSGESDSGRAWTLYGVEVDGRTYTTFDGKWMDLIGEETTIQYEATQNGKYTNYKIVDSKHDVKREKKNGDTKQTEIPGGAKVWIEAALLQDANETLANTLSVLEQIRDILQSMKDKVPF